MSGERLDALSARESNGKTYWTKLGSAFPNKQGGYNIILDAMPAPVDGQFKISLFTPKPKNDDRQQGSNSRGGGSGGDIDNIPFGPAWQ